MNFPKQRVLLAFLALVAVAGMTPPSFADRAHARSSVYSGGNVNRNTNVNNNTNINVNRNVNVDVDVHGGYHGGCCYHDYHPIATAAAVTATVAVTAAIVGSIVNTVPPGCQTVVVNGFAYQQCGSTWYQPQISGSTTTYIVVNPPR